ncbi:MAG: alpha-glucosidase/alpha-galactosidase [Anaerolineae bacterium]|nr:alpha-glucosidase/alpha-galactosidase [Anaerolineae bacterium]
MAGKKIVIIGAASATFGPKVLRDIAHFTELKGCTLSLVDIDAEALAAYRGVTERVNEAAGAELRIEATTERREALPGADYVLTSIAPARNELWQQDWEVPAKHGLRPAYGENGGPAGLFHTLRNTPLLMGVCRDMEELCPAALLLNHTNPESRLCMAISRYSRIRVMGLCHGVMIVLPRLATLLGLDLGDLDVVAAGINHFTWMLDLRHRETRQDLYPLLRARLAEAPPDLLPLSRLVFDRFGLFPTPDDHHIAEYLTFGAETGEHRAPDFTARDRGRAARLARWNQQARGAETLDEYFRGHSWADTLAFRIIDGVINDRGHWLEAVNVVNQGRITNLPDDAIVEVPAVIDRHGIHAIHVGELPPGIAALLKREILVQELAVEAAIKGDRRLALQALLVDPVVHSAQAAERTLDEILRLQADYLPQFR